MRRRGGGTLEQLDRRRFAAAAGLRHGHAHGLAGLEHLDAGAAERRHMDENVLAAVIWQNEAEAAGRIVPFNHAVHRLGGATAGWPIVVTVARRAEAILARRPRRCG